MKRKNLGILVTPHGTIERHDLDIESTVMWGRQDRKLGRPAWLTPNALRRGNKYSFAILRITTIEPMALPGEIAIIDKGVKTRQAMTEQYQRITSVITAQDSMVILIGLLTVLVLASIAFLGVSAPFIYREWREQSAEQNVDQQPTSFDIRNTAILSGSGSGDSKDSTKAGSEGRINRSEAIFKDAMEATKATIEGHHYQRSKEQA